MSDGEANAILRLGWEFNGSWYPWYVADATDAANFDAFWQHIVTTMRAVAGEQFKFLWSASADYGHELHAPRQAYPGNAYVDYVGTDVYDEFWGSPMHPGGGVVQPVDPAVGPQLAGQLRGGQRQAHRHPRVVGLESAPTEVAWATTRPSSHNMAAWFVAHNVAFDDIFSFDSAGTRNDILDGSFPNSLAEFKAVFG